ncbi:hypothetical protein HNP32_002014 [Brevundimonas bullata]|uniref:Oligosaccharide repeat unit polymerase n=1 Tax=Brevundimonas bullata TaxID=13160 RepID=A0A7W7IQM5_9CAUL|nr:O-antigen polysaccharide polymerase Wzy [Brevundimonas bullata]MBB4798270.1 hypothetical protein [Brevundimonas bullata]MBB6383416.1 hypothetical protein [Brevundimonas bullata]
MLAAGIALSVAALLWDGSFNVFMTLTFWAASTLLLFVLYLPRSQGSGILKSYFAALVVFHFGLLPAYLLSDKGVPLSRVQIWISQDVFVRPALEACLVFVLAFTLAILTVRASARADRVPRLIETVQSPMIYRVALLGLIICTAAWFVFVMGILRPKNYVDYIILFERNAALGNLIGILHTAIPATFFLATQNARKLWVPLLIFGIWAIFAFPLGLRGEVLFPIALTIPLLMTQGRLRIHWSFLTLAVLGVFFASAVVASSRVGGSMSDTLAYASPLTTISELGGSLRPSYEVERWLQQGDTFRLGSTYYAPFERTFLGLIPLVERLPANEDYRLMNVLIMQRAGPYGFSIVAESVINFGFLGALAMGALFGIAITTSASRLVANQQTLIQASILFGAFIHIRQSFVSAFGATVVFFVVTAAVMMTAYLLKSLRQ